MKTSDFLRQHGACIEGAKWALSVSKDMADVWDAMIEQGKYEWLVWTATRPGVFSDSILRKLVCRFIRETPIADGRKIWDLLTDERSRKAVEVAERYAEGKATYEELEAAFVAANAAYVAAYDAAYVAAYIAARASAYADRDVAYTAAYAAAAAYDAARAAAYDITRAAARVAKVAKAAHAQMIAELGNPFKNGRTEK